MSKHTEYVIYPSMKKKLETMGKQIKLARLRRNLTVELVAESECKQNNRLGGGKRLSDSSDGHLRLCSCSNRSR